MLGAGQTGGRKAVPWRRVGPGWALAEYSATRITGKFAAGATTLYLVDPQGGRYALITWRASSAA
ncbi:MAG TPA: hypothetical protein VGG25_07915 [Streptosporangiaceae bacterium]|jgi:hypothetical protein